jgi:hypothetical protein
MPDEPTPAAPPRRAETATLAGGCFWCLAVWRRAGFPKL